MKVVYNPGTFDSFLNYSANVALKRTKLKPYYLINVTCET